MYSLVIVNKFATREYTVALTKRTLTLHAFCGYVKLPYNSVIAAINRQNWSSGVVIGPFQQLIEEMRGRRAARLRQCPYCRGTGKYNSLAQRKEPPCVTTTNTIDAAEADGARDNTIPTP